MADKNITIWNDNQYTDNYRLSFDTVDDNPPEKLVLTEKDDDKNNAPEKWRFEVVGKEYIDNADQNLQTQIDDVVTRVDDIETKNTEQDTRLDDIETKNTEQNNRLDAIEQKNDEQDTHLTDIDTKNDEQDNRLDSIETKDIEQDNRLDSLDGGQTGQDGKIAQIENEIADDVSKLVELTVPYSIDDYDNGLYRIEANFRVHTDTQIFTIPVMGLMVVTESDGVKETYFNMTKSDVSSGNVGDVNVSYFNGNLDLNAIINRDTAKVYTDMDLTDFTYDKVSSGSVDPSFFVLKTGDFMTGNLDMQGNDILNITVNNPLEQ